ncbi:hypothetical protein [Dyella sp. 20L07]|uniref:hypothetical protein n=1 Tax=Dyella sp. 20L07 TaxID=3384240 RepID=UPI003D2CB27F
MELNFTLIDDRGEVIEAFCEVYERGESVCWRAWLYGYATLLDTLEGRAFKESMIAGQIQAEIFLRGIHASS